MKTVITTNPKEAYHTMLREYNEKEPAKLALNLLKPGSYVLSAGCGAGREIDYLVNILKCKVVGVDIDEKALELSKKKTPSAKYILGDMVKMKFQKKFDYILCLWNTINYLNRVSRKIFIETCYENLKEDGELILTTTHIFTHWRFLLSNIKHKTNYHPFPWEINEWFKGSRFKISKTSMGSGILIRAKR